MLAAPLGLSEKWMSACCGSSSPESLWQREQVDGERQIDGVGRGVLREARRKGSRGMTDCNLDAVVGCQIAIWMQSRDVRLQSGCSRESRLRLNAEGARRDRFGVTRTRML